MPRKFANFNPRKTGRSAFRIRFVPAGNRMTAVLSVWIAEFVLESAGAILNFKRNRLLSVILAIIAGMDVMTFVIFRFYPEYYWQTTWTRHAIRNMLFVLLGCSICGMFGEKRLQASITAAFLSLGTAALVLSVGLAGETIKDKLLDAEIVACSVLLVYIVLAWIGGNTSNDNKWKAAGFVAMIGSDLIFTLLWLKWDWARHWYWTGAIAAYLIWVAGPLRRVRLGEFRSSIGQKFAEVQKVQVV